jgi:capsular polysaccharide biosynthesis protein
VNRKDINVIIKRLLPVSSSVIGAPRNVANMNEYLETKPGRGTIYFYDDFDFSTQLVVLPDFFQSHNLVFKHSSFTAKLNSSRVWGRNGTVIGSGDYFIRDVSREFNKGLNIEHSIYYTVKQVKSKLFKGNIAVIGTAGANIYYHWMLDILPRLALISKIIPLDSVDYFITEFTQLPFQTETLDKVGIPVHKIIPSNENWNFHIKAETLLVPSLVGPLDQPDPFQVNFLKTLFKDCISSKPPFRRLYISRKKVGRREIVNEDELIDCLSKLNFQIIYCEEMKVADQVRLFSEAAVIISSHGSALTNLVFCKQGTIVLDIFNESHINPCFWFISRIVDLDYHYMSGSSKSIDNNPKNDNTMVDIREFKKMLRKIGLPE